VLFIESPLLNVDALDRGAGPCVLLVHSAGMGAAQWRTVVAELAADFRCIAPNQRGYGRSSPWPAGLPMSEEAELDLLSSVSGLLQPPIHVVGHSMGAWLAARLIGRAPQRFASLVLVEPVAIGLLRGANDEAALADIGPMIEDALAAFDRGDAAAALERFTDYWNGAGAWKRIPAAQRLPIFVRAAKMRAELRALWADRAGLVCYRSIATPALIVSAEKTTVAGRRMAELFHAAIPHSRRTTLPGAGHLAPISHPSQTAELLRRFLREIASAPAPGIG
jgi:pimeloyl-ACP methyl ester carboxylesterase